MAEENKPKTELALDSDPLAALDALLDAADQNIADLKIKEVEKLKSKKSEKNLKISAVENITQLGDFLETADVEQLSQIDFAEHLLYIYQVSNSVLPLEAKGFFEKFEAVKQRLATLKKAGDQADQNVLAQLKAAERALVDKFVAYAKDGLAKARELYEFQLQEHQGEIDNLLKSPLLQAEVEPEKESLDAFKKRRIAETVEFFSNNCVKEIMHTIFTEASGRFDWDLCHKLQDGRITLAETPEKLKMLMNRVKEEQIYNREAQKKVYIEYFGKTDSVTISTEFHEHKLKPVIEFFENSAKTVAVFQAGMGQVASQKMTEIVENIAQDFPDEVEQRKALDDFFETTKKATQSFQVNQYEKDGKLKLNQIVIGNKPPLERWLARSIRDYNKILTFQAMMTGSNKILKSTIIADHLLGEYITGNELVKPDSESYKGAVALTLETDVANASAYSKFTDLPVGLKVDKEGLIKGIETVKFWQSVVNSPNNSPWRLREESFADFKTEVERAGGERLSDSALQKNWQEFLGREITKDQSAMTRAEILERINQQDGVYKISSVADGVKFAKALQTEIIQSISQLDELKELEKLLGKEKIERAKEKSTLESEKENFGKKLQEVSKLREEANTKLHNTTKDLQESKSGSAIMKQKLEDFAKFLAANLDQVKAMKRQGLTSADALKVPELVSLLEDAIKRMNQLAGIRKTE